MSNEFEDLQNLWKKETIQIKENSPNSNKSIALIADKKKSSTNFHYGNILILSLVVVLLASFFIFLAPMQEVLSRVGIALMIGGLLIRIVVEFLSVLKAKKINMTDSALQTTRESINFYKFRKKIHGPFTIVVLALYSIGFYMLSPEFSKYFSTTKMILMDGSYIIIAAVLIYFIRKGIVKEMDTLSEIIGIKMKITEELH